MKHKCLEVCIHVRQKTGGGRRELCYGPMSVKRFRQFSEEMSLEEESLHFNVERKVEVKRVPCHRKTVPL